MAIKNQSALTKSDFEAALVTLRLSVSEVARESGIPRHVVSHFRNYGDGMKPEQIAKLRDYLESKGVEFTDKEEAPAAPQSTGEQPPSQQSIKLPFILADDGLTQRTALVCRHFFIDERFTDEQLKEAGAGIESSFAKAKELLAVKLVSPFLSSGYDEATETSMRELWGHLARIGLVSLHLQGRILINQAWPQADVTSATEQPTPKTLGDLLYLAYRDAVAGLNAREEHENAEEEVAA
jgi:hypothetical protein